MVDVGTTFDTPYEKGCIVVSLPDEHGNFTALDSDGVLCTFNISMVLLPEHDTREILGWGE